MTSTKSNRFNPFSLDAINFLLADVRGALGPYLNVFLVTKQNWSQTDVGLVTTFSGHQARLLALRRHQATALGCRLSNLKPKLRHQSCFMSCGLVGGHAAAQSGPRREIERTGKFAT